MKTKALRLYGEKDIRIEEFELPEIQNDEILAEVVTDSLCMSSFKAVLQGGNHKKVPNDVSENPIILGHEFCCKIIKVGSLWENFYKAGDKCCIQPNIETKPNMAPGYSYRFIGGDATYIIIPKEIMENGCLLPFKGDTYFEGSLVEPLSCVIGAFNANYHLKKTFSYEHIMGIKEGGNLAILGATGPMGFLAIDYAINGPKKPSMILVTGRTQSKIDLAKKLYTEQEAKKEGIKLIYVNTRDMNDVSTYLKSLTDNNRGFDDVFVFAPSKELIEDGSNILSYDGCFNFFSGPSDKDFFAEINFYDIHYNATHFIGTSGGNTDDMKEAIRLIEDKKVNVSKIVTHILGLDSSKEATLNLPNLSGGKKIVYTHKCFPLIEVDNISNLDNNSIVKEIKEIVEKNNGLWCKEAEDFLLDKSLNI